MRAGTPKKTFSRVLQPKRRRLGLPQSKTTSFWNCFKSFIQNNIVWISDLVPNDVIFGGVLKK